eukprot:CAMPEP_0197655300 /NCGR_PEP_ID=MMETSP1338-20131121/39375_1 /TAXON_ID=43686 ORGANISM="Pelagodinium beii, Strain RCC1491" /NCGR_SAMPLE_ID=MMETSP1338 /ASSEMBLY_ACC=CAM_ASM_000754 /LENGTH=567 /DNA_ID=CAMNT_0043230927 /DNA_START=119 /DNA_END=1822 /DNA_ORIENTATION=+
MAVSKSFVLVAVFAGFLSIAEGNTAFRGNSAGFLSNVGRLSYDELKAAVMDEVMAALGSGNRLTQQRLEGIEQSLRPIFLAMPKNEFGNLDHASARYVMHRLFVQRHAMFIKGLEPGGGSWSDGNASASDLLQDRVPDVVQSLFEDRLQNRGLGMHELAVLAATYEHLIHDEAVKRLEASFAAHEQPLDSKLDEFRANDLIDTYMMIYILGKNISDMTPAKVSSEKASISRSYPGWRETQKFARQVQSTVMAKASEADFANGEFSFQGMSAVVEEIGERYGRWQDAECRDLKTSLVQLESHGTGRVLLKDFYGAGLNGNWQFSESVDYLRELGAIDESMDQPSVLISNYVNARSNCLASSSIYSVCCINECEALLGHLETKIAEPEATVERIVELVSNLPSATVVAPRSLSEDLKQLLDDIASHHHGTVPLHGRLFAQWLHHAYPRECPYPHVSGTTNPMTPSEWSETRSTSATKAEMQEVVKRYVDYGPPTPAELTIPWSHHEELIAKTPKAGKARPWLRNIIFAMAAMSACVAFWNSAVGSLSGLRGGKDKNSLLPTYAQKQHAC